MTRLKKTQLMAAVTASAGVWLVITPLERAGLLNLTTGLTLLVGILFMIAGSIVFGGIRAREQLTPEESSK